MIISGLPKSLGHNPDVISIKLKPNNFSSPPAICTLKHSQITNKKQKCDSAQVLLPEMFIVRKIFNHISCAKGYC